MEAFQNPFAGYRRQISFQSLLMRLILVNVAVWLLVSAGRVFAFLFRLPDESYSRIILDLLALPANPSLFTSRPWTFITYMFLHIDFFHILFNMLWLFWFGKIFLEFLSKRKLLATYLCGGLAGGVLYVLFYNYFPVFAETKEFSFALGASASVMAIVTAISFYVPRYAVYLFLVGRVRIVYIAVALFILDFFMIRSGNSGGHIAHIGGALYGLAFVYIYQKNSYMKEFIMQMRSFRSKLRRSKTKSEPFDRPGRPLTDEEYSIQKMERQKKIDNILDKISQSGYESLTREEKEFLFRSSNNSPGQ